MATRVTLQDLEKIAIITELWCYGQTTLERVAKVVGADYQKLYMQLQAAGLMGGDCKRYGMIRPAKVVAQIIYWYITAAGMPEKVVTGELPSDEELRQERLLLRGLTGIGCSRELPSVK
jgi:hypothetical protein